MPNQDGTGPTGQGLLTGRGFGLCNANQAFFGRGFGLGLRRKFGRGIGLRRGLCRFFNWSTNQQNQDQLLEDYKQSLQEELEDVDKELAKLKKADS